MIKLKNDYLVTGDITIIYITRRDGSTYEVLIDTEDLTSLKEDGGSWCVDLPYNHHDPARKPYAIRNAKAEGGRRKFVKLHREITNAPDGLVVDHINGNTLDNRKKNLRVTDQFTNQQNRQSANRNSKTGIKGVHFDNSRGKWSASIMMDGKVFRKRYDTFKEANEKLTELRRRGSI